MPWKKKKYVKKNYKSKGKTIKKLETYSYKRDTESTENVVKLSDSISDSTWTSALSESINQSAGGQQTAWRKLASTSLSDVINYEEFTALYGLYRINSIVFKLTPNCSVAQTASLGASQIQIQTVFDPAGQISATSTQNDFLQIQNIKRRNMVVSDLSKPITFKFKPTLKSVIVVNSPWDAGDYAGVSLAQSKNSGWISTANADVAHLGPEFAFSTVDGSLLSSSDISFRIDKVVYISLKQVR